MLWLWTVLGMLSAAGVAGGNFYNASACFGRPGCDRMALTCPDPRRIFMFQTLYGSKTPNSPCSQSSECGHCCQIETTDCFSNFTSYSFSLVYLNHRCWNSPSCSHQVGAGVPCSGYKYVYAAMYYSCLSNGEITDFHQNITISAPAVAVRFEKTGATQYSVGIQEAKTWHCQVDTDDCVQRRTDVILVKESYIGSSGDCSSVGWSGGPFLPCVPDFQYLSFSPSTPFSVSVNVKKSGSNPVGWAVVRTQDGSNLNVTCGYTDSSSIPSPCSGTSTTAPTTSPSISLTSRGTSTTAPTTSPSTSLTSRADTSTSAPTTSSILSPTSQGVPSSARHSDVTVSMTTVLTRATSSSITSEDKACGGEFKGAMVAGWVVASVLAVLLAVLGVLLLRRHGGCRGAIQILRGKPSSHHPATAPRDQNADVNYLHVIPDPTQAAQQARRVNAAPRHNSPDGEYVNAAAEQSHPVPQQEYSSLEWSRDQANTYSSLKMA